MGVYTPDSNRVVHYTYADMTARQIVRPVHLVQYDQGLPIIAVKLYNDGLEYTIPANATVNIRCGKVDGNFVYNPALGWDSAMHTVYFEVTKQMTALAGEINPIVEIELNNKIVSSGAIAVQIDFNPVQEQSIKSTTEYITGKQYAEQAVDAAARASNSANEAAGYANTASKKADESSSFAASSASSANSSMLDAKKYADKASLSAASASQSATAAADSADEAESYAASWKGSLLPQGVVAFSELPTSGLVAGHLYAVKDKFISDSRFEEGAGHPYPQGTCVYWTKDNKWKVLSGVLSLELTKAEYDALTDAQKKNGTIYYVKDADNLIEADEINGLAVVATSGNYNDLKNKPSSLPASDVSDWAKAKTKPSYTAGEVGLGNVGNFKAVSTVANQGLSDSEKSNARANIGAQAAGTYLTEHQDISGKLDNTATGANSLLSNLTASWTAAPTDDTNFIRQDTGGKNEFGRVKFSTLLTYIKSKLSKVAASGDYNDLSNTPVMDEKLDKNTAGGIAMCSGGGKYQYFKIATIKITSSYINRPLVFELSGRGKLFSLVTIRFASTSSNDPTLEVFQTNQDRDFYIKKTGTSTWEVYGTYDELWGSYCLHRISGIGADIGIAVNMNNVSALPENCRQAVFGGCAGSVNGHSVNSDVPANAKFTDTTYSLGTTSTAGLTKLYTTVGNATDGTMTQAAINAKFYDNGTSRTANTVLSAPAGSAGSATFRKLVIGDLPIKQLTATQYAALSESEKKNGTIYLVN